MREVLGLVLRFPRWYDRCLPYLQLVSLRNRCRRHCVVANALVRR